ncbi:MAG: HIT domain-containing protein [Gammaproteobacteria bacterium]
MLNLGWNVKAGQMTECCFCDLINNKVHSSVLEFSQQHGAPRTVVTDTVHFSILGDVSPISNLHILLCPKKHMSAMADLSAEAKSELWHIVNQFEELFVQNGQSMIFFEHGDKRIQRSEGENACRIVHAHMHLVSTFDIAVLDYFTNHFASLEQHIDRAESLQGLDDCYYLFGGTGKFTFVSRELEGSQLFRRLHGEYFGESLWHWQDMVLFDENKRSIKHMNRLYNLFQNPDGPRWIDKFQSGLEMR